MAYLNRSKSNQRRDGVFISYARSDGEAFARRLRELLEPEGLALWRDREAMEGGDDWWLQITEALDEVQFMALVVTPNALKSEVVRKEWRYARQQGVCVYPIQASLDLDFAGLPRWMRDQHFYNLGFGAELGAGPNWTKFLNDLHTTPNVRRVPFIPYDRPERFVERPREFEQLAALLCDEKREEPIAITAALRGAFGYGKTTIATALCHDPRIQDAFDDGIVWVTLGQTPDLTALLADLIETLSGDRPGFTGLEAATVRLKELLADRDLLMVVDDVWNREHLRPFLQGGPRCARLVITRNLDTLPDGAAQVPVGAMQPAEAVTMLRAGLPDAPANTFEKLAARLGKWPLLLGLVNGRLRERTAAGEAPHDALAFVNEALDEEGVTAFDDSTDENRDRAVAVTLGLSFRLLGESALARFHELAIFPEDARIPFTTVERLWRQSGGLSRVKSDELYRRFFNLSLLSDLDRQAGVMQLHDAVWTYLNDRQRGHLAPVHAQLLDAHRPPAGWADLPDHEPYLWDHLAEHLVEAGCGEELVATVKDWRYLAKKTLLKKSLSVEGDLLRAEAVAPEDETLGLLWRNFANVGHLLNRCETPNDLAATMHSRFQHVEGLASLAEWLAERITKPYIVSWHQLPDLPHPAVTRTLSGHRGFVFDCAISTDSSFIVSTSWDGSLKVWDARTGHLYRTLIGHTRAVTGCAISSDGSLIISASWDHTIKIWDVETWTERRTMMGHSENIEDCAISPDGSFIVSASWDKSLKVWDTESGIERLTLIGHDNWVNNCAISPDSSSIISVSSDNSIKVWDAKNGAERFAITEQHCFAISFDGSFLISASSGNSIKVWDIKSGEELWTLAENTAPVNQLAISPDGTFVVAVQGRVLNIWDMNSRNFRNTLYGHTEKIEHCTVSSDSSFIVSASSDHTLKIWNAKYKGESTKPLEQACSLLRCAFSPDNSFVVAGPSVLDARTGKHRLELSSSPRGCAVSSDSKYIVIAALDESLKVYEANTGDICFNAHWPQAQANDCAISPDGSFIVSASGSQLKVWDFDSNQLMFVLSGHTAEVDSCAISPDGLSVVSGSTDYSIKVWDIKNRTERLTLTGHKGAINSCVVSPDGSFIVSASYDGSIKLWDFSDGSLLYTLCGHRSTVYGCAVNPDGTLIASASWDKSLKVWDVKNGKCLSTFYCDSVLWGCAWAPNGRHLVVLGDAGPYLLQFMK